MMTVGRGLDRKLRWLTMLPGRRMSLGDVSRGFAIQVRLDGSSRNKLVFPSKLSSQQLPFHDIINLTFDLELRYESRCGWRGGAPPAERSPAGVAH